jgi:hypothetical protein
MKECTWIRIDTDGEYFCNCAYCDQYLEVVEVDKCTKECLSYYNKYEEYDYTENGGLLDD